MGIQGGAQGAAGAQGQPGASVAGPQGPAGAVGAVGAQGAQGSTGATGNRGATGLPGAGATGPAGAAGAAGPKGNMGAPGMALPGATGSKGAVGSPGPAGAPGPRRRDLQEPAVRPTGNSGQQGLDGPVLASVTSVDNAMANARVLQRYRLLFGGLPDGRYMLVVNGTVGSVSTTETQVVSCTIVPNIVPTGRGNAEPGNISCNTIPAYGVAAPSATIPVNGITGFGSPVSGTLTITVQCAAENGSTYYLGNMSGIAIPIAGDPVAPTPRTGPGTGSQWAPCTQEGQ